MTATVSQFIDWTIITCNDDWASKGSNLAELLAQDFDVLFIQEGKAADYRALRVDAQNAKSARLLPLTEYGVHQDTSTAAKAGSVVIFRHTSFVSAGSGLTFGVKAPGILARYISWVRGKALGTGNAHRRVWLAAAHPPPIRRKRWQWPFNVALKGRIRKALLSKRLVIAGLDSNSKTGPNPRNKRVRWHAIGDSIDGFLLSKVIQVVSLTELPKDTSDHHPVVAHIRIPV